MRRAIVLLLGVFFSLTASVTHAGEMVSSEQQFKVSWPGNWKRVSAKEKPGTPLFIETGKDHWVFQIVVVEDVSMGTDFLKSDACVSGMYKNVGMKKLYFDTMTKIGVHPARKVIFQVDSENICGMTQAIANRRLYIVNAVARKVKYAAFRKTFEEMEAGFKFLDQEKTGSKKGENQIGDKAKPAEPVGKSEPAPKKDFGSDF